jgi:hypothetical protein
MTLLVTVLEYGRGKLPLLCRVSLHFHSNSPISLVSTSVDQHKAMTTKDHFSWKFHDPESSTKYGGIFRASSTIP